jgi:hypothetical protein
MILDTIRSLAWTDFFLYALTDPRELYRRIRQKEPEPFALSFLVPVLAVLSDILALSLMGKETGFFYYKMSYGLVLIVIYTLFKIFLYSSLVDVTAQFFGYRGNIKEIITVTNFSMFPKIFIMPCLYIFAITDFAAGFFYIFLSIAFSIWYVMILVQGLSEMHSIKFGESFLIFVLPVIAIGIVLFLMAVLLIMTGVGFLSA